MMILEIYYRVNSDNNFDDGPYNSNMNIETLDLFSLMMILMMILVYFLMIPTILILFMFIYSLTINPNQLEISVANYYLNLF